MQSHPRILMSTACRDGPLYDYWGSNTPHTLFRLGGKRFISLGLRFIKQNVPGIEILEMPTADEYRRALARGWDIVGISFYLDETRRALEMVAEARRAGAAEVWGGNYGVLTPEVRPHFDRVFLGYAEHEIAQALGHKLESLVHPPMVVPFGMPFWKIVRFGLLFTTRGCCFGCTFCQTPAFAPKPSAIPLESIERVLKCYADHGVVDLLIPDENFGILPGHARAVGELLARHGMLWTVMTRVDYLLQHFDEWKSQGLAGVMIGIESMAQEELNALNKRSKRGEALRSRGAVPATRDRDGGLLHHRIGVGHRGIDPGEHRETGGDAVRPGAGLHTHATPPDAPLAKDPGLLRDRRQGLQPFRRQAPRVEASGPEQGTDRGPAAIGRSRRSIPARISPGRSSSTPGRTPGEWAAGDRFPTWPGTRSN